MTTTSCTCSIENPDGTEDDSFSLVRDCPVHGSKDKLEGIIVNCFAMMDDEGAAFDYLRDEVARLIKQREQEARIDELKTLLEADVDGFIATSIISDRIKELTKSGK